MLMLLNLFCNLSQELKNLCMSLVVSIMTSEHSFFLCIFGLELTVPENFDTGLEEAKHGYLFSSSSLLVWI